MFYVVYNNSYFLFIVWSPALRTGVGWEEYLQFDFGTITRINRVKIETPPNGLIDGKDFRGVEMVKFEITNSLPNFNFVAWKGIPYSKMVDLDSAVQTRYMRLTIKPKQDKDSATTSIAVYK